MGTKLFTIAALLCVFGFANGENRQIDSLKIKLKTSKDTNRVKLLNELSYLSWSDGNQYEEALKYANQAKLLSDSINFQPGLAIALRRIGIIHTGENPALALQNLFKSLQINEQIKNLEQVFLINGDIGVAYYNEKNLSAALKYFLESYKYRNDDPFTLRWIGIIYLEKGDYIISNEFLQKSLRCPNQSDNDKAETLNILGTINELQNKIDTSLTYYFLALKKTNDPGIRTDVLASIGDAYFKNKNYNESIKYELWSLNAAIQIKNLHSIRETKKILSNIYDSLGDTKKSFQYYKDYIAIDNELENSEQTKKTVQAEMNYEFDKKQIVEKTLHAEEIKRVVILRNSFIGGFIIVLCFSFFLFRSFRKTKKQKAIIENQKHIVEEKQNELEKNINYAALIQRAMLPSDEYLKNNLPENYLIYRGRDIVSGDMYWSHKDELGNIYYAVGDCTSHGISASLLTMIVTSLLNEIVIHRKITQPNIVLNVLRKEIISCLNKEGSSDERKEGCDICFVKINGKNMECASANNSVYVIRKNTIHEVKGDRFPVGKYIDNVSDFTLKTFELADGDVIYTSTDGAKDQFSGETNRKLMAKKFKEWLVELSTYPMLQAKIELENRLNSWIGTGSQTDDITIFAVKI